MGIKPRRQMAYPAFGMLTYKEIAEKIDRTPQYVDHTLRLAARKLWRMTLSLRIQDAAMVQVAVRENEKSIRSKSTDALSIST